MKIVKDVIFLLTKDCMSCESLSVYGNTYWNMSNIDELARKGTVFKKHYSAGCSTAMSVSAMLSGHYPYEFESRKIYVSVKPSEYLSVFDYLQKYQYECHVIWDVTELDMTWRFVREFGDENKTIFHNLDIAQATDEHSKDSPLIRNDTLLEKTCKQIYDTLINIDFSKKQFVWMHLPHILKGRKSYMDDMDAFDGIVGFIRNLVGDDSIFITTDHGHMNMHKGKVGYGFDVYEPIIHIPLISPRIDELHEVDFLTSNIDLPQLLLKNKVIKRDYIISETAYYAQPKRKIAIVTERFKYIFNKKDSTEELYDLYWDPNEDYNILKYDYYDKDRRKKVVYSEHYFYPYKNEALKTLSNFRKIRLGIWRDAPKWYVLYSIIRKRLSFLKKVFCN